MAQIAWTLEAERWLSDIHDDGNVDILGVFHGALDISNYSL
jgi:hypothetical protein